MRRQLVILLLVAALTGWAAGVAGAQAPTTAEAQAIWDAFWSRVAAGDVNGARRYVHTTRLGFPWMVTGAELRDRARQMQHCRLGPGPLPASGEDVLFEAHCEFAGEKATVLVGFRQDADGAWRLTVL